MLLFGSAAVRRAGGVERVGRRPRLGLESRGDAGCSDLPSATTMELEAGECRYTRKSPCSWSAPSPTLQFLVTIGRRLEPALYVALWYLIGAFVWTTMNLVLGSFILPYTISGINSAAFHGLYIHYIVGLWLTPAGYVLI